MNAATDIEQPLFILRLGKTPALARLFGRKLPKKPAIASVFKKVLLQMKTLILATSGIGWLALSLSLAAVAADVSPRGAPKLLDGFEDISLWQAMGSDNVSASSHTVVGMVGQAVRLDFDFNGAAGYAYIRRKLPLVMPDNYEISFYVRADAPVNNLEFKLIDGSGDNVWWVNRPNYEFPREWQQIRIKKRHIGFAWGPIQDQTLRASEQIEFVISAGRGGGRGSVYFDELTIRELPPDPIAFPAPRLEATSSEPGFPATLAMDGSRSTSWRCRHQSSDAQALTIDLGVTREFGGLILRWVDGQHASRYDITLSDDGNQWRRVREVVGGNGGMDPLMLPESEARFVRLNLMDGPGQFFALSEIEIKDLAFGKSPNAFFEAIAVELPRGQFPRSFSGQQAYWTVVGIDGGHTSGLMGEDGAIELAPGGVSIEPIVIEGEGTHRRIVSWAGVAIRQSLVEGYLPIPVVTWTHADWELQITSFAAGVPGHSQLAAKYQLRNLTRHTLHLELVLATRPFQINPPAQFLNTPGGVSPIGQLDWNAAAQRMSINNQHEIVWLSKPSQVGFSTFDGGSALDSLLAPNTYSASTLHDPVGLAAGIVKYRVVLQPHAKQTFGWTSALEGHLASATLFGDNPFGDNPYRWLDTQQAKTAASWRAKLNKFSIRVPAPAQAIVNTLRSSLAHMLILRDGAMLRPGTRSYGRSWIRDGAMMAEGLLRLGQSGTASDYLRWYAPYQFASGKVPCCVDQRGADPVTENDSHGQLIFLVAEVFRYTRDRQLLEEMWPHLEAAIRHIEILRQSERRPENLLPSRKALYGLLPESISHEGYSAKPMHSYWDDFWALIGYKSAVEMATVLGRSAEATRWAIQRDEFRAELIESIRETARSHKVNYIAGAAELGDFDATSTTIALAPGGEQANLPDELLSGTFERYWKEFSDRRAGRKDWQDYTPYELRTVGAFIRLGRRERAHELLTFFLNDRQPREWNQWAEVVGREKRKIRFVGDIPHGWIASDYIRTALDLFAYERPSDQAMVIGAGITADWLDAGSVAVSNMHTPYGPLAYDVTRRGKQIVLNLRAGSGKPPGGWIIALPPLDSISARQRVLLNGKPIQRNTGEIHVNSAPARVVVDYAR